MIVASQYKLVGLQSKNLWSYQVVAGLSLSDYEKKCQQLYFLNKIKKDKFPGFENDPISLLESISGGNPRLMERINRILEFTTAVSHQQIISELITIQEEFREEHLIFKLFQQLSQSEKTLLSVLSVFFIPVPYEILDVIKEKLYLQNEIESAEQRGLIEQTDYAGKRYIVVSSLVRPVINKYTTIDDRKMYVNFSLNYVYELWFINTTKSEPYYEDGLKEVIRLATLCDQTVIAVNVGDKLANAYNTSYRHQFALTLCSALIEWAPDWRLYHQLAVSKHHLVEFDVAKYYNLAFQGMTSKSALNDLTEERQFELLWNYSDFLMRTGELNQALELLRDYLDPFYRTHSNKQALGAVQNKIADILLIQGLLEDALVIRKQQLKIYESINDTTRQAIVWGKIADIAFSQGKYHESSRIRMEQELPIFEKLEDSRSIALTKGSIAEGLKVQGQLDEALRIHREEELPIYERLKDTRLIAVTFGHIADILIIKGDTVDAELLLKQQVLPTHESLGDIRSMAITHGKLADINLLRGEWLSALCIHQKDELPIYYRLKDVKEQATVESKIADLFLKQGQYNEAMTLLTQKVLPKFESVKQPKGDCFNKKSDSVDTFRSWRD